MAIAVVVGRRAGFKSPFGALKPRPLRVGQLGFHGVNAPEAPHEKTDRANRKHQVPHAPDLNQPDDQEGQGE
jgi:hypothetical protein